MVCISVFYANAFGKKFDHGYYARTHMPLVMDRCKSLGLIRYEIDTGVGGGAPGSSAPFLAAGRLYFNTVGEFQKAFAMHGREILADVPNYTDIQPEIQVSELASS